jgi:hypothetical protein
MEATDRENGRDVGSASWSRPWGELYADLHASPDGLSTAEAAARLAVQGPNLFEEPGHQAC